jgi:preprotein translocase subunit SecA
MDEARTPLIISGPLDDRSELYNSIDTLIQKLSPTITRSTRSTLGNVLTEVGNEKLEGAARRSRHAGRVNRFTTSKMLPWSTTSTGAEGTQAVQRDKDYIVRNDEIVIIDEFTGRMMPGRRYSEGQHQALEAKEGVKHPAGKPDPGLDHLPELFPPVLDKLAGMTGTAATEAEEFGTSTAGRG